MRRGSVEAQDWWASVTAEENSVEGSKSDLLVVGGQRPVDAPH